MKWVLRSRYSDVQDGQIKSNYRMRLTFAQPEKLVENNAKRL